MASILSNILAPTASLFSPFPSATKDREEERYLEQIITTGLAGGCLLYFSCSKHSHFVVSILQIFPVSQRRRNILCRHRYRQSDDSLVNSFYAYDIYIFAPDSIIFDCNFKLFYVSITKVHRLRDI